MNDGPDPPPTPVSPGVRRRMQRQATRDTQPELELRRLLHRMGYRYRVDYPLPVGRRRRADVAFPARRVAVFIDGCFWHACPEHATWPANNEGWWMTKLRGNVDRDRDTDRLLRAAGWNVVRIWEHEPAEEAVAKIIDVLNHGVPTL